MPKHRREACPLRRRAPRRSVLERFLCLVQNGLKDKAVLLAGGEEHFLLTLAQNLYIDLELAEAGMVDQFPEQGHQL